MSKIAGHKVQLAMSVLKGKREELKHILKTVPMPTLSYEQVESRIEVLTAEIETFENNLKKQEIELND